MVTGQGLFEYLLVAWMALALITFVGLWFVTAYGRHTRRDGDPVDNKLAWIIMEARLPWCSPPVSCWAKRPALVVVLFFALWGTLYPSGVHLSSGAGSWEACRC